MKTFLLICLFFLAEMGSEGFDKFLNLLGDTITLQGWAGYRGGLDTKSKRTHLLSSTLFKIKGYFIVFVCVFVSVQMTLQELSPSTQCIKAMNSCFTCPPCCPTLKRTNSRCVSVVVRFFYSLVIVSDQSQDH